MGSTSNAKKSLCEKSGTPLIVLNSEFVYINSRKAILKKFLSVYKDTLGVIDLKELCGLIYEQLHNLDISTCKLYGFDYNDVLLMEHRLQIYKSQERKDMLLVLLWQILMYTRNLKILNTTLNKLNHG